MTHLWVMDLGGTDLIRFSAGSTRYDLRGNASTV